MSAQNFFINEANDKTGHGDLDYTYSKLADQFNWKNTVSDVKQFVESSEICQVTMTYIQQSVGLLIPLTVQQRP